MRGGSKVRPMDLLERLRRTPLPFAELLGIELVSAEPEDRKSVV